MEALQGKVRGLEVSELDRMIREGRGAPVHPLKVCPLTVTLPRPLQIRSQMQKRYVLNPTAQNIPRCAH